MLKCLSDKKKVVIEDITLVLVIFTFRFSHSCAGTFLKLKSILNKCEFFFGKKDMNKTPSELVKPQIETTFAIILHSNTNSHIQWTNGLFLSAVNILRSDFFFVCDFDKWFRIRRRAYIADGILRTACSQNCV